MSDLSWRLPKMDPSARSPMARASRLASEESEILENLAPRLARSSQFLLATHALPYMGSNQ